MNGSISTLDFVYMVLGIGLIPFFILLCMVLWRVYKMMDNVHNVIRFVERITHFVGSLDKYPTALMNLILSKM